VASTLSRLRLLHRRPFELAFPSKRGITPGFLTEMQPVNSGQIRRRTSD